MGFADDCRRHTDQYRKRLNFVAKNATERVVNAAQQTVYNSGRMPLQTGFLRASLAAKIGGMPSGQSTNPDGKIYGESENVSGTPIAAALIRWKPETEVIYLGYTAVYSRPMEFKFGFVRGAAERWDEFVRRAVNEATRKQL